MGAFDDFLGEVAFDEAGEDAFVGEAQDDHGGAMLVGGFVDGGGDVVGEEEEGVDLDVFGAELLGDEVEDFFAGLDAGAAGFGAVGDVDGEEAAAESLDEVADGVDADVGDPSVGDSEEDFAHGAGFLGDKRGIIPRGAVVPRVWAGGRRKCAVRGGREIVRRGLLNIARQRQEGCWVEEGGVCRTCSPAIRAVSWEAGGVDAPVSMAHGGRISGGLKSVGIHAIVRVSPGPPVVPGAQTFRRLCVAHTLSANKRVRQTVKRRERNRDRKREIRLELKTITAAIAGGDKAAATAELKKAQQVIDRVATRGTIHPNTAARRKSKLARRVNAIAAAK